MNIIETPSIRLDDILFFPAAQYVENCEDNVRSGSDIRRFAPYIVVKPMAIRGGTNGSFDTVDTCEALIHMLAGEFKDLAQDETGLHVCFASNQLEQKTGSGGLCRPAELAGECAGVREDLLCSNLNPLCTSPFESFSATFSQVNYERHAYCWRRYDNVMPIFRIY